ncbi:MAG: succinyl-diaminopimelate desuccinylase [Magnetococcales bacterium]|nr:succinyl-diaminopimelate desuccinylase [Magnetococcales bacterium]
MKQLPSPLELAIALIQAPSVTPQDQGCQTLLITLLQELGFTVHPLRFGEVDNFYARIGPSDGHPGKNFCFAGHTDVVSTGDPSLWRSPPFAAEIHDGHLIGRGASDMKGGIAAMLAAAARFLHNRPDFIQHNTLSFLITGDEEGVATDGTVRVLHWLRERQERLDYCLLGEPTCMQQLGDGVKIGRRGSLNGTLILHGRQGHVAYPHLADNPIHRAAPLIARLARHAFDAGNAHFPATSLQFTNIYAGDGSHNVIPDSLRVTFNFRFSTESTPERLEQQLRDLLDQEEPALRYTLTTQLSGLPFLTAAGPLLEAVTHSVRQVTGITPTPSTGGGTSDARFISLDCPQTVEFGLLSTSIHQINEQLRVADLEPLTQVYEQVLHTLFPAP